MNKSKRNQLITLFMNKGYSKNAAIGLVANFENESSLNPNAHNPNDPGGSYGLAQWNRGRLKKLKDLYGSKWNTLEAQVDFVDWELKNDYKKVGDKLKNVSTFEEATHLITTQYEIPANASLRAKERINTARSYTDIIPEDYDYTMWQDSSGTSGGMQLNMADYVKQKVKVNDPRFNYETNMGVISSAPDMPDEEKSEIAKISLIQKQLTEMQEQMMINQQQQPAQVVPQQQVKTVPQAPPSYSYLSNPDLFTIQPNVPQFKQGGRAKNRF